MLERELDGGVGVMVGVIEHCLFIGMASLVLIGTSEGVKRLDQKRS